MLWPPSRRHRTAGSVLPPSPTTDDEVLEILQRQQLGYLASMKQAGSIRVADPLSEQLDDWCEMSHIQVESLDEVRRRGEVDLAMRAGREVVDVMRWYSAKGAVTFPL